MSTTINDGGPAFPTDMELAHDGHWRPTQQGGMSLRDYFAGQALVAWAAARIHQSVDDLDRMQMAVECYHDADAMIAARHH